VRIPLMYMRVFAILFLILLASGQTSPPANGKKDYVERRAVILRQMAEIRAKLAALELELQLLDEARSAEPGPVTTPPPTAWREEPAASGEGSVKKSSVRCLSVTRGGKRCTRPAEQGGKFCWQHRHH